MSDGFLAFGFSVDIVERQIYFDEFFVVFGHGVWLTYMDRLRIAMDDDYDDVTSIGL